MILEWISSGDVALFSPMILGCQGQGRPRQYILTVWISFIRPWALLPPRRGPWAWDGMSQSLYDPLAPQLLLNEGFKIWFFQRQSLIGNIIWLFK